MTLYPTMTISILGCGWYGTALARALIKNGFQIKGSVTRAEKLELLQNEDIKPYRVVFDGDKQQFDPEFFNCKILFVSIPPRAKHNEVALYLAKLKQIIKAIIDYDIKKVVYVSSTGVYDEQNQIVNELTDPKPDNDPGKILLEAEHLFRRQQTFKTTIIRFAGLVGPGRDPGRFFANKKNIPNGQAPINLIHLDDCIGISQAVIESNLFGQTINASSPYHPAKSEFYRQASLKSGFEPPEFLDELLDWKIVESVILTAVLNYKFKVPALI